MSDFFGGILDSISHIGDDVSGFFNSSIGQALAKGVAGGMSKPQKQAVDLEDGFYRQSVRYSPTNDIQGAQPAEDYTSIEVEWLRRLQDFAGLTASTEVRVGDK